MTEKEFFENHFKGRIGNFLEIGAFDGIRSSHTISLLEKGWKGVYVEPNPKNFIALIDNYKDNPKVQLVHAAVHYTSGLFDFWDDDGGEVSSLELDFVKKRAASHWNTKYVKYKIATITMKQLLETFPYKFDLVIIDTEGISELLFKEFLLEDVFKTEVVCVEYDNGITENLISMMLPNYDVTIILPNVIGVRKN